MKTLTDGRQRTEKQNELEHICNNLDLVDIWRVKHPSDRTFTWSNKNKSLQSRIDFWLISAELQYKVESAVSEPAVLTDHKAISIKINMSSTRTKLSRDYWKLNSRILQNEDFQLTTQKVIEQYWSHAKACNEYRNNWELMKFQIRQVAIKVGKQISTTDRQTETTIVSKIIANLRK